MKQILYILGVSEEGVKMEDKKGNIILGIILAILMVVAIAIVIINPNKVKTVNNDGTKNQNIEEEKENIEKN